jgi:hypothetical protein
MMTSSFWRSPASSRMVPSVGSPAGTITQTARGAASWLTMSLSEPAPTAPSFADSFTMSGERS